jgi:hypothetical protein
MLTLHRVPEFDCERGEPDTEHREGKLMARARICYAGCNTIFIFISTNHLELSTVQKLHKLSRPNCDGGHKYNLNLYFERNIHTRSQG